MLTEKRGVIDDYCEFLESQFSQSALSSIELVYVDCCRIIARLQFDSYGPDAEVLARCRHNCHWAGS